MSKIDEGLNKAVTSLKEGIQAQLAIGQASGESYNAEDHVFLEHTLKMTSCTATKELEEKKKIIEKTSQKMVLLKEFETIQKEFGDKYILDYPGLLQLCTENNLFFGHNPLFNGDITADAFKEAKAFNFSKARSILRVGKCIEGEPVVGWDYDNGSYYDLIIAAPITMFKLDSPHKIVISNREIVKHPRGNSSKPKGTCTDHDPIMLLPFRSADKKIYFIVITNWENTPSV